MRLLATLVGGLLGVLPGLLHIAFGQLATGGGDGMIGFGVGGVSLMAVGFIAGAVVGWRNHDWFSSHVIVSMAGGLLSVASIVAVSIALGGPPDPIQRARDCPEVYEWLGATGPQGEILDLPPLSEVEMSNLSEKLDVLGDEDGDEVCLRLRDELES